MLSVCADEDDVKTTQQVVGERAPGRGVYVDTSGLAQHLFEVLVRSTASIVDRAGKLAARNTTAPDWTSKAMRGALHRLLREPVADR